jgi:hypothetical protein
MIKTNCELPVPLLEQNTELNDFDFVLYHLLLKNKKYREYFTEIRKKDPQRLMIMDNSSYEFFVSKKKFKAEDFVDCVKEIQPDYYILPDTLMRMEKTLEDSVDFHRNYGPEIFCDTDHRSLPLAVIQGVNPEELIRCLKMFKRQCLYAIGIPFHNSFYKDLKVDADIKKAFCDWHDVKKPSEDMKYAMGRVQFLRDNADAFKFCEHIHILGSHDPYEKVFIDKIFPDKSLTMDTGYPVKIAINGWELGKTADKPEIILDEFLDQPLDPSILELIKNNVKTFKNL